MQANDLLEAVIMRWDVTSLLNVTNRVAEPTTPDHWSQHRRIYAGLQTSSAYHHRGDMFEVERDEASRVAFREKLEWCEAHFGPWSEGFGTDMNYDEATKSTSTVFCFRSQEDLAIFQLRFREG